MHRSLSIPAPIVRTVIVFSLFISASEVLAAENAFLVPQAVRKVLTERCIECHSGDAAEGDVQLDTIQQQALDERLKLLNQVQEQLFFSQMPPEDAEQPAEQERVLLSDWLSRELRKHNASQLEQKLQRAEFGNYVDHDKLFSGEFKELPGFTYDRRWLISEYIFNAKFQRILQEQRPGKTQGAEPCPVLGRPLRINQPQSDQPVLAPQSLRSQILRQRGPYRRDTCRAC